VNNHLVVVVVVVVVVVWLIGCCRFFFGFTLGQKEGGEGKAARKVKLCHILEKRLTLARFLQPGLVKCIHVSFLFTDSD
jgi:hypothetical protein